MLNSTPSDPLAIDRRTFVKTVGAAGLGLALGSNLEAAEASPTPAAASTRKLRYAIIGTGHRHRMYHRALMKDYRDHADLVALCDINPGRVEVSRRVAKEAGVEVPGYVSADFEKMIKETKPDFVIVTTVDATHDDY